MGNTTPGSVTKMLTLLPVLAAVYFYDLPKFATAVLSADELPLFVLAVSLFLLGVSLKRKILAVRLEVSGTSFGWGLLLLALAVALYIYGSFSSQPVWFHYESMYLFILAYVTLRIGGGLVRALSPLLAILALSLLPVGLFPDTTHQAALVLSSGDVAFLAFLAFVGLRVSKALIPLAMVALATAAWYASAAMPGGALYLDALVPVPLLLFALPRVRRFASLSRGSPDAAACPGHRVLPTGFCSVCGLKLAPARLGENVGAWGLVSVLAVAALLLFPSLPVLAVVGGAPHSASYSPGGVSSALIPQTPRGWQVNSTTLNPNEGNDTYAVTNVYVPQYHPERANYTVDLELSALGPPAASGPFGGGVAGWNRSSNVFTSFGPLQGYLTTYVAPGLVMLAYHGSAPMSFVGGGGFGQYYVGMGFVRVFKNSNVSSDTAAFTSDVNQLWIPSMNNYAFRSQWTAFLESLYLGSLTVVPFLLLVTSAVAMGWGVYRARLADDHLDIFLTTAVSQPEDLWSCLSWLLRLPGHTGTSSEVAVSAGGSPEESAGRVDSAMRELERARLVGSRLTERGADIVVAWRAPA